MFRKIYRIKLRELFFNCFLQDNVVDTTSFLEENLQMVKILFISCKMK